MVEIIYAADEEILKEAGFWHIRDNEVLNGAIDGTNKSFLTNYRPIYGVDALTVTVNDAPADVSEVIAAQGRIDLVDAPASGSNVLATYYYSAVDQSFVNIVRQDAQGYIDAFMRGFDPCSPYTDQSKINSVIRQVTRLYAAGLLSVRDYGRNIDTELTSKDGYKKLELAKQILTDFRDAGGACGGDDSSLNDESGGLNAVAADSNGNLFKRERQFVDRDNLGGCEGDSCFQRGC